MKKTNNKKGFTIVELVIVIAVIAILAAVLIPTFSGVINKANESGALQQATALYKDAYAVAISDGKIAEKSAASGDTPATYEETVISGELAFVFSSTDGSIDDVTVKVYNKTDNNTYEGDPNGTIDGYKVTVTNGVVSVSDS